MTSANSTEETDQVSKIWFFGGLAFLCGGPMVAWIWLAVAMENYPALRAEQMEMYRKTLVGNCVDVDPIPEGKIVRVLDGSEAQVKVALTDPGGRQSMTFMPLDIALKNIVSCRKPAS